MQISTLSPYILVHNSSTGKGQIDAFPGIAPKPVGRSRIPASQGSTLFLPSTDSWRRPFQRGFRHAKVSIFGLGNIVGTGHIGPYDDDLAFRREYLYSAVLPVAAAKGGGIVCQCGGEKVYDLVGLASGSVLAGWPKEGSHRWRWSRGEGAGSAEVRRRPSLPELGQQHPAGCP